MYIRCLLLLFLSRTNIRRYPARQSAHRPVSHPPPHAPPSPHPTTVPRTPIPIHRPSQHMQIHTHHIQEAYVAEVAYHPRSLSDHIRSTLTRVDYRSAESQVLSMICQLRTE